MEAATKRGRTDNRRCSGREGDWVCLYCSNYNYSFRTICNRCQAQTRERNEQEIVLLSKQHEQVASAVQQWPKSQDTQNEDPLLDDRFPQALLVTPPKVYQKRGSARPLRERQLMQQQPLYEYDLNQSKKAQRAVESLFEKENMGWVDRLLEE